MTTGPTKNFVPVFIWAVAAVAVTLIICLTVLSAIGADSTEVSRLLNTTLNFISPMIAGGGFLYARQAAEASRTTVSQTNGDLDKRIQAAVSRALSADRTDSGDTAPPRV